MKTLITAAAVLVASAASAQVAVTTAEAINVEPNQARAITAVCAAAYSQASGQPVTTPLNDQSLTGERVELQLIGLDGARSRRILVRAQRRAADGAVVHEATLDALSMEDTPVVCQRLATSLVTRRPVADSQEFATVTAAEATSRRRRVGTNKSFGVKSGFTGAVATNAQLSPMGTIAFDARIEGERFFTMLGVGALIPAPTISTQSYGGVTLDMGGGYYFTDTDFAPYVGIGVQPRIIFGGSIINFVPYAQVGITTSRKSGVRFNLDGRVGQNMLPVAGVDVGGIRPTEFSLNVGVGF